MTLLTQMWFAVLFVAAGKAVGLMGLPSVHIVTWIIRGMAGALVIAALQFFLAAQVQSFATPVAMGAAGGVAGLLAANSRAGLFFPYSQMLLGMNSNKSEDVLGQNVLLFSLSAGCILSVSRQPESGS